MIAECIVERENVNLHCKMHGDFNGYRTSIYGRSVESQCPYCKDVEQQEQLVKQQQEEAKKEQEKINRYIANICLPFRFEQVSFSNYSTPTDAHEKASQGCFKFAANIANRQYANLILMGGVGTGKTHLAAAICKQLAGQCISARYSSVREIVRSVRETWGSGGESEASVLSRYTNPDVLVIDEVGVQNGSANEQTILFDVINERYELMLPVVLVSNLDVAGIKHAIGDRSFDRVRDAGSSISFTWGSFRGQANKGRV